VIVGVSELIFDYYYFYSIFIWFNTRLYFKKSLYIYFTINITYQSDDKSTVYNKVIVDDQQAQVFHSAKKYFAKRLLTPCIGALSIRVCHTLHRGRCNSQGHWYSMTQHCRAYISFGHVSQESRTYPITARILKIIKNWDSRIFNRHPMKSRHISYMKSRYISYLSAP